MIRSRIVSRLTRRGRNSSSASQQRRRRILRPKRGFIPKDGKSLADFIETSTRPAISSPRSPNGKSFSIQTYGCQMNTSDTEIVRAVLSDAGYAESSTQDDADVLLLNTCADSRESGDENMDAFERDSSQKQKKEEG